MTTQSHDYTGRKAVTEQRAIQERLKGFYADTLQASKFEPLQQHELSLPLLLSVPQAFLEAP